jgi:uncharacterized protein
MYNRDIETIMDKWFDDHHSFTIYGARQVGKTTLVKNYAKKKGVEFLYVDCDQFRNQQIFTSQDVLLLKNEIGKAKLLILDEAQRVKNIGLNMKIIHDNIPEVKVIATGSSSLDLASEIKEPMTGRDKDFYLHPLSVGELMQKESYITINARMDNLLTYGMYPGVFTLEDNEDKKESLFTLTQNYLYKDLLEFDLIKKNSVVKNLLKVLAFSIGSEVTTAGLAQKLEVSKVTIDKYIDLLEQCFIIKKITPFHRSIINEIKHPYKVYFWDLGVRNALLEDFTLISMREDRIVGAMWENFCVIERIKKNMNERKRVQTHFWRTNENSAKEYDMIEVYNNEITVFEIKTNPNKADKVKKYPIFFYTYANSGLHVIHKSNWQEWLV